MAPEIARRCKTSLADMKALVDAFCKASLQPLQRLEEIKHVGNEKITTGDPRLDHALGGGIRTGMIWEVAGESAAGKTQLALQLSLLVQLPPRLGGLSSSACYITTSSTLPTTRLLQILNAHPLLSSTLCGLSNVHTISTPTIAALLQILSTTLPQFLASKPNDRPIKLIVIDSLAELFHTSAQTTTNTLVERSRSVSEISVCLHTLASKYQVAILVLNEVVDVFVRQISPEWLDNGLLYFEQSKWFSRAHSIPLEDSKEVSLGLVWANQVNARMLLSRTGRRRYISKDDLGTRIQKPSHDAAPTRSHQTSTDQEATLIRRFTVIFSSVAPPTSLDYIVTEAGISTLVDNNSSASQTEQVLAPPSLEHPAPPVASVLEDDPSIPRSQLPLDVGFAEDLTNANLEVAEDDEWEQYWKDYDLPEHVYSDAGFDVGAPTVN
ncbi:P-loop containing nucleoside triphosphate hydrolase protein [Pleurotus eryngii]|uniref:P-loop containing nucleoside triphosphate hydrolase protein n=1 Tax=Pleurotus eryngii TaxID=5323 RepID=A0A9P6A0G2_PLEER|nr:P-loop containing nucleoside triphosphate hydrolase protein [Pleurotus eryngii]